MRKVPNLQCLQNCIPMQLILMKHTQSEIYFRFYCNAIDSFHTSKDKVCSVRSGMDKRLFGRLSFIVFIIRKKK